MAKAFQKIYTKITQITKATGSVKATDVGYDELATVDGRLAQVVKIINDEVTLQIFEGTEGIPTNAEVVFLGKAPSLKVGDQLAGRFFNAYGDPIGGWNGGAAALLALLVQARTGKGRHINLSQVQAMLPMVSVAPAVEDEQCEPITRLSSSYHAGSDGGSCSKTSRPAP